MVSCRILLSCNVPECRTGVCGWFVIGFELEERYAERQQLEWGVHR
jgi:hypothetical protein